MKLLKLVYFAHGWHLAITNKPLIIDPVEAWEYGPVVPALYRALKKYGSRHVDELLPTGDEPVTIYEEDKQTLMILDAVWKAYGHFRALQLSDITHMPGTPWYEVVYGTYQGRVPYGVDIEIGLIRDYFRKLRDREAAHV